MELKFAGFAFFLYSVIRSPTGAAGGLAKGGTQGGKGHVKSLLIANTKLFFGTFYP